MTNASELFTQEWADAVFPAEKTDAFFEALYGKSEDGAYDIRLRFVDNDNKQYRFQLELHQRPGQCLACNLTYGLPEVFARHPVINVKGLVEEIAKKLELNPDALSWEFMQTQELSTQLHLVPLVVTLKQ